MSEYACDWPLCRNLDCGKDDECLAPKTADMLRDAVESIVKDAADEGLVLAVDQRPLQPLAMGNYETVVIVRPARSKA